MHVPWNFTVFFTSLFKHKEKINDKEDHTEVLCDRSDYSCQQMVLTIFSLCLQSDVKKTCSVRCCNENGKSRKNSQKCSGTRDAKTARGRGGGITITEFTVKMTLLFKIVYRLEKKIIIVYIVYIKLI